MRRKKPRVVSLDEVKITRRGDAVEFEYADEAMGGMSLTLGVDVSRMSDEDLLERHNEVVLSMEAVAASYEHVPVEVPIGRPQLRYVERADQWVPRGDVLRCIVQDGGPDGEATIEIDDRELSLREFGRMLTVHAGWGMRIVFVPDDEIHEQPVIEVREPEDPPEQSWPTVTESVPGPDPRSRSRQPPARPKASTPKVWDRRAKTLLRMPIYRLRIALADTEPAVWRSVLVSGNLSLKKLHETIQIAMGWTNSHLHMFASANGSDLISDPRFGLEHTRDEAKVKLRSFAPDVGARFHYEYDLGDSWKHDILVEEILTPEEARQFPRCVAGERACPPEDCGGVHGFLDLVAAMSDRRHPEREHYLEWLGREFEPEAFDLEEANRRLRPPRA
jgi:hypothetical protein